MPRLANLVVILRRLMPLSIILRVEKNKYELGWESTIEDFSDNRTPQRLKPRVVYSYPNVKLLPISVIAIGLSIDYLSDASTIQKTIDMLEAGKGDAGDYKKQKTRKQIVGGVFLAAGLVNLFFVFEKVKVRTDGQQVMLSYAF